MNESNNELETLEETPENRNVQDIPKTFFTPIEEVQEGQEQIMKTYEASRPPEEKEIVPDLSNEVRVLEQKLKAKKFMMPFSLVLLIVLVVNFIWFLGVRLVIVPRYEEFTEISDDMKRDYEDLKRKVNAIVGDK